MINCPKCAGELQEKTTKAGVIIDVCKQCHGYWLDQGELNFFCKSPKLLYDYEKEGLQKRVLTQMKCPKCSDVRLYKGKLPGLKFSVEECPECRGLFLDNIELKKLYSSKYMKGLLIEKYKDRRYFHKKYKNIFPLAFVTGGVLLSIYALLFGFAFFLVEYYKFPKNVVFYGVIAVALVQFLLGPFVMDWSLRFLGSLNWVELDDLPEQFSKDLKELCRKNKLPLPKFGIINDGTPSAFTYGRTPYSARIVFSWGIFNLLDEEEQKAVLAHELGHVKHWDFVVMTVAKIIPLVFYQLYREIKNNTRKLSSQNSKKAILIAYAAYVMYKLTEYFILFISRLREYYADQFSCRTTKNPNALLKALVKIGLGLAVTDSKGKSSDTDDDKDLVAENDKKRAVQAMGIMNIAGAKALMLANGGQQISDYGAESLKEVMKWDLWNPWALYYELKSTHPLTSKRINAISYEAIRQGQAPFVSFDLKQPESYWDDFFKDLFILTLPIILVLVGVLSKLSFNLNKIDQMTSAHYLFSLWPTVCFSFGIGGLIRLQFQYPGTRFLSSTIEGLLRRVKVSPVRSYPVKIKGRVIGRGESGYVFSEDMILQDNSGIIYLDHEPFGLNLFFALKQINHFKGQEVTVKGWYRRAPTPFIEVKEISSVHDKSKSYTKLWKTIFYFLLIGLSFLDKIS